ncbi:Rhomboid-like protein 19 [Glycine soja]|uniref:Rhomboid-like protein 19 n=1 Tax=Glycine soja TaxID=3848 RepID=A0A445M240_GLYSO|nr:Rhomboid-like protein 19 [Glycine soja]
MDCSSYMPLSGFHGVVSGFLVGIKFDTLLWLSSIPVLLSIAISFWTLEATTYLPTIIFGTYISWIYLRYWQRKPETKHRGDLSEDFAFSTFPPEFLRLVIDPIASIFHRMLNGRYDASNDGQGNNMESEPLPGSDSIEASRRR